MLANPTSTADADADRRDRVEERIDDYNSQLAKACRAYDGHCRYDGGDAHRTRFTLEMLSRLDYFHPNAAGQQKLAEATFPRRFTW
jgi:lysophospholipase L1-like esterase